MSGNPDHTPKVCTKCGTENPPKTDICTACGSHLYLLCRKCRHRNYRGRTTCEKCGAQMRSSSWKKLQRIFIRREGQFRPMEIVLAAVIVYLLYRVSTVLIEFVSNFGNGLTE